jgi:hypothetical protein
MTNKTSYPTGCMRVAVWTTIRNWTYPFFKPAKYAVKAAPTIFRLPTHNFNF